MGKAYDLVAKEKKKTLLFSPLLKFAQINAGVEQTSWGLILQDAEQLLWHTRHYVLRSHTPN